jgi:hypothetical protein
VTRAELVEALVGERPRRGADVALERGLSPRYVTAAGAIIDDMWRQAIVMRGIVGQCRRCDGAMLAVECPPAGDHAWYTAVCAACGGEVALAVTPGVALRRSSRRDEMPSGAWQARLDLMKQLKQLIRQHDLED